jgi:hypothetical protein
VNVHQRFPTSLRELNVLHCYKQQYPLCPTIQHLTLCDNFVQGKHRFNRYLAK